MQSELVGQILNAALTVQTPSQDGGESKRERAEGQQWLANVRNFGERHLGEYASVAGADVGICHNGRHNGQPGEGADDYGVPKGGRGGYKCLAYRILGLRRGGNDGGGTQARLVGEKTAGNAVACGNHDAGTHQSASSRRGVKGRLHNQFQCRQKVCAIDVEDGKASYNVDSGHKGNQHLAAAGNALYAAHYDSCGQDGDNAAYDYGRDATDLVAQRGDGIGLDRGAYSERGKGGKEGKGCGHQLPEPSEMGVWAVCQSVFNGIHGTAQHAAVGTDAVFYGQQPFAVFGGDAQDSGKPAPKHRSRSAQGNGGAHSHNVSGTNSSGQGGGQGSEL